MARCRLCTDVRTHFFRSHTHVPFLPVVFTLSGPLTHCPIAGQRPSTRSNLGYGALDWALPSATGRHWAGSLAIVGRFGAGGRANGRQSQARGGRVGLAPDRGRTGRVRTEPPKASRERRRPRAGRKPAQCTEYRHRSDAEGAVHDDDRAAAHTVQWHPGERWRGLPTM